MELKGKTGVLIVSVSLLMYSLANYESGFYWLRSVALAGFVIGLVSIFFNMSLVKTLIVPLISIGLLISPTKDVNLWTSLAICLLATSVGLNFSGNFKRKVLIGIMFLVPVSLILFGYNIPFLILISIALGLTLAFFRERQNREIPNNLCLMCQEGIHQGVEFCLRCGRLIAIPKKNLYKWNIFMMIIISSITFITTFSYFPTFTYLEGRPTIKSISLYNYEDEGFAKSLEYKTLISISNTSMAYSLEDSNSNLTLRIFVDDESSFSQEIRDLEFEDQIIDIDDISNFPSAKFLLLNESVGTRSIAFWSITPYFISQDGFTRINIGFMIDSRDNSIYSSQLVKSSAELIAEKWSYTQWLTYNLFRSWQLYLQVIDYIPILPTGGIFLVIAYLAKRKDRKVDMSIEYALNMSYSDQILYSSVKAAASKTGSATSLQVDAVWRQISGVERNKSLSIDRLEQFARLNLLEKCLVKNGPDLVLKWKPMF
jgi:hypothetical protein